MIAGGPECGTCGMCVWSLAVNKPSNLPGYPSLPASRSATTMPFAQP